MLDEQSRNAEQQGADGDPDRVVAAEQGDGDAGEAEAGGKSLGRRSAVSPSSVRQADQAGDGAGR